MDKRAEEIFADIYVAAPEEREALLAEACGEDAELRLAVQRLLVDVARAADRFGVEEDEDVTELEGIDLGRGSEREGDVIGPYILRQKIGEGGFGVVWMAEQSEPLARMVALKVVKAGMDTKHVLARFEAERQALAMMDHPNIAKVFDAGATPTGRPYFAMELVKGVPITRFCDEQEFGPRRRLELFQEVCLAVQHAHQKGIIHRDLKPSNVMVTLAADEPVIKVIDFGIAKATHSKLTDKTLFTRFEQFLGTPVYMSPEQAAMSSLDVDTRADIYSLGVLLYELLAGTPPFDQQSLLSAGYDEMRRIIKEDEPPKPSTRIAQTQAETAPGTKKKFHVNATSLRGELDWIVMKAIEKDRTRRYETANALALDIKRFLTDEPVSAAAPSVLYKCRKFARRNKLAFGAASAIAAALVLGLGISILSYSRERAARLETDRQRREATEARDLADRRSEEARQAQRTAEEQTQVAVSVKEALRKQVYQSDMNLASVAHDSGNIVYLNELLEKHWPEPGESNDLRGFEWFHWWQTANAQVAQSKPGPPLGCFDISPDFRMSAVNVWGAGVEVRSTGESQEVMARIGGAPCLAFSPDGSKLLKGGGTLSVFDTTTWARRDRPVPGGGMTCLAFSPANPLMASGGDEVGITLWDTETWEVVGEPWAPDGTVRSLAFTRDGGKLIAGMEDSRIVVWDLATRAVVRTLTGHGKSVHSVVHSPGHDLFASGSSDESVHLWNGDFELLGTYEAFAPVMLLRFSPDGRRLIGGTSVNNSVLVWNVEQHPSSLDLVHVIKGHSRKITGLAFLDGGDTVVSVSDDGSSKTWDLTKGAPSVRLGRIEMPPPTWADNARLTYGEDGKEIWITDPGGKRYSINLDSHELGTPAEPRGGHTLAITRDGAWQAGAAEDGHLAIRNARQGILRAKHPSMAADARSVVVFSAGPTVAWKEEGVVHIWNVNEDTTRTFGDSIAGLPDLSPRGDRMAVYRWDTTSVWDITVDPPVVLWQSPGWGPEFRAVFSPDGTLVAAASHNNQIRLLAADSGNLVLTLKGHTDAVQCMGFSRDGSRLVSGGRDRTIRIWDVEGGQLLSTFVNPDGPVWAVGLSPSEDSIASLTDNGVLRLWTSASAEEVSQHVESWRQRARIYSGSHRWDRALALLEEGLEHIPDSGDLLLARGEVLQNLGDLEAALKDITRASALAPLDKSLIMQRAHLQIVTGQRSDAAESYRRLLKLSPENEEDWMRTAALLISTGDLDRYHQLCKDMLERFHDPEAQEVAERVAKACLVVPSIDSNLEAAVESARKSVADPDHWVMAYSKMTRGLAEYRSGNYEGARDWCHKALEDPVAWHVEVNACLVLAMSESHLGQTEGTRKALGRAAAILDAEAANFTSGNLGKDWHDWFFSRALQQEAEAIMDRRQTEP